MLYYIEGDLLKSDCTIIMHQANCMSIMGGGIAKSIARKYPLAMLADKRYPYTPKHRFGKYSYATNENGVTVVNLYGQYELGRVNDEKQRERMVKLELSINTFLHNLLNEKSYLRIDKRKIGVPYKLGCGLAGGDWNKVRYILETASESHGIDIYIYKL